MTFWDSILLGLIQGLTEFLPISSSGHLVLGKALLGLKTTDIVFEVLLHMATLIAVFIFFFREIRMILKAPVVALTGRPKTAADSQNLKYFFLIIIGTIPAVIAGLFWKDFLEQSFSSLFENGVQLLITSAMLFLTVLAKPRRTDLKYLDSIAIGIAQAVAILPGISRSGATISTAMYLGVDRATAFNYSFLLSLPAIFGAFLLELKNAIALSLSGSQIAIYAAGMVVAFAVGYLCLILLRRIVIAGRFAWFGFYTLIIGLLCIVFSHA